MYFGSSTGSCTLANSKVLALGDSAFSAGRLTLKNFTKLGTNGDLSLTLTGSASMNFVSSVFNTNVTIVAPGINVQSTRFVKDCSLTKSGNGTQTSIGGNYFGGITSIINNSASSVFTLGSTTVDTFAVGALIKNQAGTLQLNNAIFNDTVRIINLETSTTLDRLFFASTGTCQFKKSIVIQNTGSGLCFGNSNGETQLDSTRTLTFVSGVTGNVTLQHFIQAGSGSLSISFPSDASKLILGPNSTFNANFNYYGKNVRLNGVTFNAAATITKYGSISDTCSGGNVFNGTTIITDSLATSHKLIMAYTSPDDYNSNVTFVQKGTGAQFYPAYTKNSTFSGNITVDASSAFQFGGNGGKVILDGSGSQILSNLSSASVTMKKLQVNKSSNSFTLAFPLAISDSLNLTKGWMNTDTTNLLSLANGCKLNGGSDSSFVNGPLKKTGNSAFVFPTGSSALPHSYHPLEITAPSSTIDSYTANYFSQGQTIGTAIDTSIDNLNACQYWKLTRDAGTSTVGISLSWNNDSCEMTAPSNIRIVGWNGSIWKDLHSSSCTGNSLRGTTASLDSTSSNVFFTFAFNRCSAFSDEINKRNITCYQANDGIAFVSARGGTAPYKYLWSNGMGDKPQTPEILFPGQFSVNIKDSLNCQLNDTIIITQPDNLQLSFTKTESTCNNADASATVHAIGGVGLNKQYLWLESGQTGDSIIHLPAGEYSVLVTDSNNCSAYGTVQINDVNGPTISPVSINNVNCFGEMTGSASIEVSGGKEPYLINWSSSELDSGYTISSVFAGLYSVKVIDNNGCISFDTIEINQPDTFKINLVTIDATCTPNNNGEAIANVVGGTNPYFYYWYSSPSINNDTLLGRPSGVDTVEVTDGNGCKLKTTFEIMNTDGFSLSTQIITHENCFNDGTASAKVDVTGGGGGHSHIYGNHTVVIMIRQSV